MAIIGNTIRLRVEFKTFAGTLSDPEEGSVTLKFYDSGLTQYGNTITLTNSNKKSTGIYEYDYVVPNDNAKLGRGGFYVL